MDLDSVHTDIVKEAMMYLYSHLVFLLCEATVGIMKSGKEIFLKWLALIISLV